MSDQVPQTTPAVNSSEENKQAAAGTPKYGCLMLKIPMHDAAKISKWSDDNIDIEDLDDQGIEREIHVTVLYGFKDGVTASDIQSVIKNEYKKNVIDLELKDISRFDSKEYDVLKMDVESKDLVDLNSLLKKHYGDKIHSTYPDYHPHLTLAYVNKGACKDLDGNGKFAGSVYSLSDLVYSDAKMNKTDFKIGAVKANTEKKDAAFLDVKQNIDGGNNLIDNGAIGGDVSGVMANTSDDANAEQRHRQEGVTTMHSSDPSPCGGTGIPGASAAEDVTKTDPNPAIDNRDVYEMEQDTRHAVEKAGLHTKGASISDFHWKVASSPKSKKTKKKVFKLKTIESIKDAIISQQEEDEMLAAADAENQKQVVPKKSVGQHVGAALDEVGSAVSSAITPVSVSPQTTSSGAAPHKIASIGSVLLWPHFGGGGLTGALGATALMSGVGAGAGAIHHGVNKLYSKAKSKITGEEEDEDPNNGITLGDRMKRYALLGGLSVPVIRGAGALFPGVNVDQAIQANEEALKPRKNPNDPLDPLHPDAQFVPTPPTPPAPEVKP